MHGDAVRLRGGQCGPCSGKARDDGACMAVMGGDVACAVVRRVTTGHVQLRWGVTWPVQW